MKVWKINLIEGVITIIIGIGFLIAAYKTSLGIPYDINPKFESAFLNAITLLVFGLLIFGVGLGTLGNTYTIYSLEKRVPEKPTCPVP